MQNTLSDLNNHLFAAMERLNDEDLAVEELDKEIARSRAVSCLARSIIENANLTLDTVKLRMKLQEEQSGATIPKMLN